MLRAKGALPGRVGAGPARVADAARGGGAVEEAQARGETARAAAAAHAYGRGRVAGNVGAGAAVGVEAAILACRVGGQRKKDEG